MGHHRSHWDSNWQGWVGPGWAGSGSPGQSGRSRGSGGPPPWVQGLLGWGTPPREPGPRVRRGDVRTAILDVVRAAGDRDEPINGYQVIQEIAVRSNDAWRPSPGSVYPTVQQLQDEGLLESDDDRGRRTLRLTDAGRQYAADHADELAAVWAPFETQPKPEQSQDVRDLKSELGQVMSAVWQIVSQGSDAQRHALADVLVETRRTLYGILADGPAAGRRP